MDRHHLETVSTSPDQLNPQSIAYLRAVEASAGAGHPGILVWHSRGWSAGPRGGWWLFLFLGLALLGALGYVCWEFAPQYVEFRPLPHVQAALAGFGTLFLLVGVTRFLRRKPQWLPQSFLYADASFLWEVTPNTITAVPLPNLENVDGTHHSNNGSYSHSEIQLTFPDRIRRWTLHGKRVTENLINFLQYLIVFRTAQHENVREWASASPGRLGAAAARFVARGPDAGLSDLPEMADPPAPYRVPPDASAPKYGWGGSLLCLLGATAAVVAGFFAFPVLNNHLQDEYLFAQIPERDNSQFGEMERYLATFPAGRHAPMVREMLDDRHFAKAQRDADQLHSPGSLRAYLADRSNQRHRPAAQRLIADYYDLAIGDLKKKQAKEPDKIDKDLFEGVIALLEALKRADRPVVTVGFKATLEREPVTKEHKDVEKFVYASRLKDKPELKAIADRSPSRSAIIEAEQVFDKEQSARREAVILERLRGAVRQGINADILTLESSVPGEAPPMMEVAYHVLADGHLGTYTGDDKRLVGLLRWYAIHWTISIRPPGTEKSFIYKLQSRPGSKLTYDSEPSDPSWAIYAVLLYSGFYDMSARLIRNFGLDPGETPNAFNFAATARQAPDTPEKPLVPEMPFPNKRPRFPERGKP